MSNIRTSPRKTPVFPVASRTLRPLIQGNCERFFVSLFFFFLKWCGLARLQSNSIRRIQDEICTWAVSRRFRRAAYSRTARRRFHRGIVAGTCHCRSAIKCNVQWANQLIWSNNSSSITQYCIHDICEQEMSDSTNGKLGVGDRNRQRWKLGEMKWKRNKRKRTNDKQTNKQQSSGQRTYLTKWLSAVQQTAISVLVSGLQVIIEMENEQLTCCLPSISCTTAADMVETHRDANLGR